MEDDPGLDFAAAFGATFGSIDRARERMRSERAAAKTAKQRARKAVRTVQINFRASPSTKALSDRLAEHLDCSVADVMERALIALAEANGIDPP